MVRRKSDHDNDFRAPETVVPAPGTKHPLHRYRGGETLELQWLEERRREESYPSEDSIRPK